MKLVISFTFEKDTKNTNRYTEVVVGDAKPVVGTLYVAKSATGETAPETLTVTIEG